MDWNALNPMEWYLIMISAAGILAAGSFYEWGARKSREAKYWERKYKREKNNEQRVTL